MTLNNYLIMVYYFMDEFCFIDSHLQMTLKKTRK